MRSLDRPTKERNYSIRTASPAGLDTVGRFFLGLGKPADVYNFFTGSLSPAKGWLLDAGNTVSLSVCARSPHTNIETTWEESNEQIDRLEKPRHRLLYFRRGRPWRNDVLRKLDHREMANPFAIIILRSTSSKLEKECLNVSEIIHAH